ncbi:carbamate kinase [Nocardioides sp. ChNu-153]|uniref:carbamate kinase n=1 Tax=Nocardioides sp. ChNu-153 TaxID=2779364 RepID=UPI00264FEB20|nr:carbamate kinase [Nocardioides sp. ChNu-153]MDN7119826.1 carbamate kinase [Nocardioides sp. ChNu-153]
MRALIALGGNAMTGPDGSATVEAQRAAIDVAADRIAELVATGTDVVVTHGNGPQVGNLLVKNELTAHVVPMVPLDWCGAQTQGTLGYTLTSSLDAALTRRGIDRRAAGLVTRTVVDAADPDFLAPSKPVGRFLPEEEAQRFVAEGQLWQDRGEKGWRRVVPSPQPREIVDAPAVVTLVEAGYVVVAAGGGGIPVLRAADGSLSGVEAVIDKDLGAALLGAVVHADVLVIATDVDNAIIGYGTPQARPLGRVTASEMREIAAAGHFAAGSMGPKVEAALRFAESGGTSVITSLDRIRDAVTAVGAGSQDALVGTVVVPDPVPHPASDPPAHAVA